MAMSLALLTAMSNPQGIGRPTSLGRVALADRLLRRGTVSLLRPGDPAVVFPTIQAAVDAASTGDTILLGDGVFTGPGNVDVVVQGKDVWIRSLNGPRNTIIDCQEQGRAFFVASTATDATRIEGIAIVNGRLAGFHFGGGIYTEGSPVIYNCYFERCSAYWGGAIGCGPNDSVGSNTLIDSCTIADCHSLNVNTETGGGGIWGNFRGNLPCRIVNTTIRLCTSGSNGGGIWISAPRFVSTFSNEILIDRCVIESCAADYGGGIYSRLIGISNTIIEQCSAEFASALVVDLCNDFECIASNEPDVAIRNCTVVNNQGGSLAFGFGSGGTERWENNIFWNNRQGSIGFYTAFCSSGNCPTFVFKNNDVEGGMASVHLGSQGTLDYQASNIDQDPMLADLANEDVHLLPASPCIDTGNPATALALDEKDVDLQPRLIGSAVDMGADELSTFSLLAPIPGVAGETNVITASGAIPGVTVTFFAGTLPGALPFSFGYCPDLELGMTDAMFLATVVADCSGRATHSQFVDATMSGTSLIFHAVAFDLGDPVAGCRPSNLVSFTFP